MALSAATDGDAGSTGPQPQTGQENPLASANGALELAPWECMNAMIKRRVLHPHIQFNNFVLFLILTTLTFNPLLTLSGKAKDSRH